VIPVLDGGSFVKYGIAMKTMNYIGTSAYVRSVKKNPNKPSMYASLGKSIDKRMDTEAALIIE